MIDVSIWCAVITKGVSVWGSFYTMAVRTCKKAVRMAGLLLFFFLGGCDPPKEKSGLATQDYTRRL